MFGYTGKRRKPNFPVWPVAPDSTTVSFFIRESVRAELSRVELSGKLKAAIGRGQSLFHRSLGLVLLRAMQFRLG